MKTDFHPRKTPDAVVCLHCSAGSGRQWAGVARSLGDRFTVIAPDLLGADDAAPWPLDRAVSLDDEVAHLAPWLEAHPEGVHLVGHSYGGAVALQVAIRW